MAKKEKPKADAAPEEETATVPEVETEVKVETPEPAPIPEPEPTPEPGEPALTLEQYARLKNLNAFRQGRVTALVGKNPRTESAWTRDITAVGG